MSSKVESLYEYSIQYVEWCGALKGMKQSGKKCLLLALRVGEARLNGDKYVL